MSTRRSWAPCCSCRRAGWGGPTTIFGTAWSCVAGWSGLRRLKGQVAEQQLSWGSAARAGQLSCTLCLPPFLSLAPPPITPIPAVLLTISFSSSLCFELSLFSFSFPCCLVFFPFSFKIRTFFLSYSSHSSTFFPLLSFLIFKGIMNLGLFKIYTKNFPLTSGL